ncbi:MAG: GEVED domain-containing protein, partial [Candidatus Cloacimonadaceae bacterium]|nr:GEVED domain-containing protein [Candidatus Cloacimonadaceae bacterium]
LGDEGVDDQFFLDPAVPLGSSDRTGPGFPLGFTINFLGSNYDRIGINANGWVGLGHSSLTPAVNMNTSSAYNPLGSTTAMTPHNAVARIAVFARDLQAQAGATLKIREMGTAPDRYFEVEWINYRRYNLAGDSFTARLTIYEDGSINITYGDVTPSTATTVQVGLRGEPSNVASNFNNRSSTTSWEHPPIGATAAATMTLSPTVKPMNQCFYTWFPPVAGQPPNPANVLAPANGAINVSLNPTLSWASGGGMPTGYDVYFNGALVSSDQPGTTYTPATLAYGTSYNWQIVPRNANGPAVGCPTWSFTTLADPTITAFPWTTDFGTTTADLFPPLNWTKHSGPLANPTVLGAHPSGSWVQDDWLNNTTIPNKAAKINIYGTANGWLITPPIAVPNGNYEVNFDVAYMLWNGQGTAPNQTGVDDIFAVLVGDGTSWTPANIIRQWDNAGSPYVLNDISPNGINVSIPLGAGGTRYIAFYGISTVSNADNDLMVDNVTVREVPAAPIFSIAPTSWNYGSVIINTPVSRTFTVSNTGGGSLDISSISISGTHFSITTNPAPVSLTTGQSAQIVVQYLPTAVGTHNGTLTINDNRAVTNVPLTGNCLLFVYDPSGATSTADTDIGQVVIGDFANPVNPPTTILNNPLATGTYSDFTHLGPIPIQIGAQTPVSITQITSGSTFYSSYVKIFIDYNQNGVFDLPGEVAFEGPITQAANPLTGTLTVPGGALLGTTRLRVVQVESGTTANTLPTGTYSWGETEDYTAEITPPIVAPPVHVVLTSPANGSTGVNPANLMLQWTAGIGGGIADYYGVFVASDPDNIFDEHYFETEEAPFNLSAVQDIDFQLGYLSTWYWSIIPINGEGSPDPDTDPGFMIFSFTTQAPPPEIEVSVQSLTSVVDFGETDVQYFTITNDGGLPLNYSIALVEADRRAASYSPNLNVIADPNAARNAETSTFVGPITENSNRAIFDLQFNYATAMNDGEYGVATDGNYFYTSKWSSPFTIRKYDMSGTYIGEINLGLTGGIRDLTYDGTYFYGSPANNTIYQMDFTNGVIVGSFPSPVATRGIAYDSDTDTFWVGNQWTTDMRRIDRAGNTVQTLTLAEGSCSGLAYDNVS